MDVRRIGGFEFISGEWPLDGKKRTLLFVHGAALNCNIWEEQVKGLSGKMNTIAVNMPGHGEASAGGLDSIEGYAGAVLEFIRCFRITDPVLCGLSMGGAVVLDLLLHSDLASGGIVINTGAKQRVTPMIFESIEKDYDGFREMVGAFGISPGSSSEEVLFKLNESTISRPDVALGDFRACDNFDVRDELHQIGCPVLVLTATEDNLSPPKYGEFIVDRIRDSRLVCIEGAGHFSPLEKPENINGAINSFLDELEILKVS